MNLYKKAKGGSEAGTLVGIITVLLVLYILFIPATDRDALLGENTATGNEGPTGVVKVLLEESVGRLDYHRQGTTPHPIADVNLYSEADSVVITKLNPFNVRSGWFEKTPRVLHFSLSDLSNTQRLILTLDAPIRKGTLILKLNDNVIYEFAPEQVNIGPIELPKSLLRDSNELEISVSSVGWKFWTTNEYSFEQGQIIADIIDVSKQQSASNFIITEEEKNNIERVTLSFFPACNQQEIDNVDIILNGRRIYSSTPSCRSINIQEVLPEDISAGKNDIIFKATKGEYRIEQIKIETELKESSSYIQYFQIDEASDTLLRSGARGFIEIVFVDDRQEKKAEISVNGHLNFIDQEEPFYEQNINAYLTPGNNYIELRPESTLNINELRVVIR